MASPAQNVFINCPFDDQYRPNFHALVFAVFSCGFQVRCALEMDDAAETRIDKIYRVIEQSQFGIHDLSKTELDQANLLPRFNMPLELGVFLGAKRFGENAQRNKRCLILDREKYRFQKFISDLSGMDITSHEGNSRKIVACVRDWLVTVSKRRNIPPSADILNSYDRFVEGFPEIAKAAKLDAAAMVYADFERLVLAWVKQNKNSR